jgi:thioredoxin 1
MKTNKFLFIFIILLSIIIFSCNKSEKNNPPTNTSQIEKTETTSKSEITFIELGSVNCIPCKQMQPIMKSIETKYGEQVKVIFYDVWKDKKPAEQYGIKLIPTQVFLDKTGKEVLRHEGFFPEDEIDKFFQSKGLKIIN